MLIREASGSDLSRVTSIVRAAFGQDEEAELVENLLEDPSAKPILSLLAERADRPVGHILFSAAGLAAPPSTMQVSILAPLSVVPDAQRQGIGGALIERGAQLLSEAGVGLLFVLGHPHYYVRHGFEAAGCRGFEAPYPIPPDCADAWMVRALGADLIGTAHGKIRCADALTKPEYWRE